MGDCHFVVLCMTCINLDCLCAVRECVENLDKEREENLLASLWGAERCLRVLESVSKNHFYQKFSTFVSQKCIWSILLLPNDDCLLITESFIVLYIGEAVFFLLQ